MPCQLDFWMRDISLFNLNWPGYKCFRLLSFDKVRVDLGISAT